MRDETTLALRPDLFGQLAATDPFQGRARRLYERGQVLAVNGNQADVRVGYDARNYPLDLKEVPIVSGYIPRVGDWVALQYEAGHSGAPWVAGPSMAADDSEDTPGIGVFSVSSEEPADPQKSTVYFHEPASTWRGWNGAAWVDLGGGGGGLHNSLPDLQGGAAGQYYHLTAAQWNALVGNMPFGAGAVLYANSSGYVADDADSFSWDAVNKRLGIGTDAPAYPLDVVGQGNFAGVVSVLQDQGIYLNGPTDANWRIFKDSSHNINFRGADYQTRSFRFTDDGDNLKLGINMASGQLAGVVGSAGAPTYSFFSYPTMGMFAAADGIISWSTAGVRRMSLDSQGWLAVGATGNPVYPIDARWGVDGMCQPTFYNYSTDAAASMRPYFRTDGGGDCFSIWMLGASTYWSVGIDNSENDRWCWALGGTPGASDVMRLERSGVWWLFPHSPSLAADGQAAMDSVQHTWVYRFNAKKLLGASQPDDARVADVTVYDSGGTLAEQDISVHTLPAGFSAAGNSVKVVAKGTARVNPKASGGGANLVIKFRIESTDVFTVNFAAAQAAPATWIHWEFSFDATMRSSTSWEISNVKSGRAEWSQVGNPWPTTFTPTVAWYGRDTVFAVAGDITTSVRCSITNGAPGSSYITVASHKAGLEQF